MKKLIVLSLLLVSCAPGVHINHNHYKVVVTYNKTILENKTTLFGKTQKIGFSFPSTGDDKATPKLYIWGDANIVEILPLKSSESNLFLNTNYQITTKFSSPGEAVILLVLRRGDKYLHPFIINLRYYEE